MGQSNQVQISFFLSEYYYNEKLIIEIASEYNSNEKPRMFLMTCQNKKKMQIV